MYTDEEKIYRSKLAQERFNAAQKGKGLIRMPLWVHKSNAAKLKRLAKKLEKPTNKGD